MGDLVEKSHLSRTKEGNIYPTKSLYTDVIRVWATRGAINNPVPELIISGVSCHSAEQLAPVFH